VTPREAFDRLVDRVTHGRREELPRYAEDAAARRLAGRRSPVAGDR
jgi:hypothetical protein